MPRVTDPDDVFHDCLADDQGLPLTKDGHHAFCFSALPQYQQVIQQRMLILETRKKILKQQKTLLQEENQPIEITHTDELAMLYLTPFYMGRNIKDLDGPAILKICSKASAFSENIRKAAKVVGDTRSRWAEGIISNWNQQEVAAAFANISK